MSSRIQKETTTLPATLARRPAAIRAALEIIRTDPGCRKFPYAQALRRIGEQQPRKLYPFFDDLAGLLRHPNNIIQWTAIRLIAALAAVDDELKLASPCRSMWSRKTARASFCRRSCETAAASHHHVVAVARTRPYDQLRPNDNAHRCCGQGFPAPRTHPKPNAEADRFTLPASRTS